VLVNQRTKETKYYSVPGADEKSAMASAEGQVQNLRYTATFPLLLNIGGQPTYFVSLKDDAQLVKKYAMVNVGQYQVVAIGDTVPECEKEYLRLMSQHGIGIDANSNTGVETAEGAITEMKSIVKEGNTYFYIRLEGVEKSTNVSFRVRRICGKSTILVKSGDTVIAHFKRDRLAPGEMEHIALPKVLLDRAPMDEVTIEIEEA